MKPFRLWLAIGGLFAVLLNASAQYTLVYSTNGSDISITNFTGTPVSVTVPNFVTSIGVGAFAPCQSLVSIVIPDSVTYIGVDAFLSCEALVNVDLGHGVTNIDDEAFYLCDSLTSINIPVSVTNLGGSAFADCEGLTNITLGHGMTNIGDEAFESCDNLPTIVIPDGVTIIGRGAFYGCGGLTNVTLGTNVVSIGESAFFHCSSLGSLTIPNSVTNLGMAAFAGCAGLTNLNFGSGLTEIASAPLFDMGVFAGCSRLSSVTIPASITNIGDLAFAGCTSLTNVTISRNVTSIGHTAFDNCYNLTTLFFLGNAPSVFSSGGPDNGSPFAGDPATIYFMAGTGGWGTSFQGVPTALWNPTQPTTIKVGARTNGLGLNISGPDNIAVVVQASTNMASKVWTNLFSCHVTNGSIRVPDPAGTNFSNRFYRMAYPVAPVPSGPSCDPAPAGLVAWFSGNDSMVDYVNNLFGSEEGGVTFAPGEVGGAFNFDGSSGSISVPASSLWNFGASPFSIEFWANFTSTNGTQAFLACDNGAGSQNKWIFFYNYQGGGLVFHMNGDPGNIVVGNVPFSPEPGQWYHIAVTRNGAAWTFYVNGSVAGTGTQSASVPAISANLTMGNAEGSFFFNGSMDEVSVYANALTSSQIAGIYLAGSSGKCWSSP